MIKIKVLDENGKEKEIILNPDSVVTIEKFDSKNYYLYLADGRVHKMTKKMYQEQFDENEI
jgi:hypothetical protein